MPEHEATHFVHHIEWSSLKKGETSVRVLRNESNTLITVIDHADQQCWIVIYTPSKNSSAKKFNGTRFEIFQVPHFDSTGQKRSLDFLKKGDIEDIQAEWEESRAYEKRRPIKSVTIVKEKTNRDRQNYKKLLEISEKIPYNIVLLHVINLLANS